MFKVVTYTGRMLTNFGPRDPVVIEDVAVQLGRTPRFCGSLKKWVSVLHHSVWCERIADFYGYPIEDRINCFAHDFHEAFTGDIPSPMKCPEMRKIQKLLDEWIYGDLQIPKGNHPRLKKVDKKAMMAEAYCFGDVDLEVLAGNIDDLEPEVVAIVRGEYNRIGNTICGIDSHGVRLFIDRFHTLRDEFYSEYNLTLDETQS